MDRALWRSGVALVLVAALILLPGCLTPMLWRGYGYHGSVAVPVEGGGVTYVETSGHHWGDTTLRVIATPFAVALDVIGFVGYVWFLDRIHGWHHRHGACWRCSH